MVVFGGYGGQGFARADFNDLYSLNLLDWSWKNKSETTHGEAPAVRSGHTANVIMGRW